MRQLRGTVREIQIYRWKRAGKSEREIEWLLAKMTPGEREGVARKLAPAARKIEELRAEARHARRVFEEAVIRDVTLMFHLSASERGQEHERLMDEYEARVPPFLRGEPLYRHIEDIDRGIEAYRRMREQRRSEFRLSKEGLI